MLSEDASARLASSSALALFRLAVAKPTHWLAVAELLIFRQPPATTTPTHAAALKMKYMYASPTALNTLYTEFHHVSHGFQLTDTELGSNRTFAHLQTVGTWADNCATATPRNFSRSPRGLRSPSRPEMSLLRVSGLFDFRDLQLTVLRRSPSKHVATIIHRTLDLRYQGKLSKSLGHLAVSFTHVCGTATFLQGNY